MHLFGPKGETSGFLKVIMIIVFFLVGWLEIVSILFRPVSLSFRFVREHLRRGKHAGSNGQPGAVAFAG